ncbi:cob(I)yrinic acid a,c-diamide adenosyltransferase [Robbsia sp. KACC 23696]|uniref:cob(I)yrinic acid a,c-diamide adenosyltransferase n=1 Tax=Robbsia sp. KACC 23696 TaxID=3149231 RepID=UPI00325B4549
MATGKGNRLTKIVTRTGDDGTTGLGDLSRVPKTALRIAAIGDVDELNATLGLFSTEAIPEAVRARVIEIQHHLFNLGGELAMPGMQYPGIDDADVAQLDAWIADVNAELPPLREFILPGGSRAAASAHVARTVCRRAERTVWRLAAEAGAPADAVSRASRLYLNRLSDLLFVMSRQVNLAAGHAEVYWRSGRNA